jgi:hypothetical protein
MPQHEECNLFLEDFEKSERSQPCGVCGKLGLRVLGGSHKRKDTGNPSCLSILTFNPLESFLPLISHLISPSHPAALKLFLYLSSHFSCSCFSHICFSLISFYSTVLAALKSLYISHLTSYFFFLSDAFRKIAQAGGGGHGQVAGDLWCRGDVRCSCLF